MAVNTLQHITHDVTTAFVLYAGIENSPWYVLAAVPLAGYALWAFGTRYQAPRVQQVGMEVLWSVLTVVPTVSPARFICGHFYPIERARGWAHLGVYAAGWLATAHIGYLLTCCRPNYDAR